MFTIGYQGEVALVDGTAKRQYGSLSTKELTDLGLLKAALCSALYSGDDGEVEIVMESYKRRTGVGSVTVDQLKRTLGVFSVPEGISKVKVL